VYNNLALFMQGKNKKDNLFGLINTIKLNLYISEIMPGLTAKVFRTYNASHLFQQEINDIYKKYNKELSQKDNKKDIIKYIDEILNSYNKANIKVALLCNHQKNISKNFKEQISKFDDKLKKLKKSIELLLEKKTDENVRKINKKIKIINDKIKITKNKKNFKVEMKNLSLDTSKTNYIDPRITIAFLKKFNIPIEKIFSPTLRDKFFWAMDVDENWQF